MLKQDPQTGQSTYIKFSCDSEWWIIAMIVAEGIRIFGRSGHGMEIKVEGIN